MSLKVPSMKTVKLLKFRVVNLCHNQQTKCYEKTYFNYRHTFN